MSTKSSGLFSVRRQLSFIELPYVGKTFYIDVRSTSLKTKLIERIQALGGEIETFLTKDISLLVTDKEEKDFSENDRVKKLPNRGIPLSRGQALLLKASAANQEAGNCGNTQTLLQNAASLGLKTQSATTFLRSSSKLVTKLKAQRKANDENDICGLSPISWENEKENLSNFYIKVEDEETLYRPLFKQFESFPTLSYSGTDSPFDTGVTLNRKTENNQAKKKAVGGALRGGYCESCDHWYKCTLREHLNSEKHKEFIESIENFQSLNDLTDCIPNFKKFVNSYGLNVDNKSGVDHSAHIDGENSYVKTFEYDIDANVENLLYKSEKFNEANEASKCTETKSIPICDSQNFQENKSQNQAFQENESQNSRHAENVSCQNGLNRSDNGLIWPENGSNRPENGSNRPENGSDRPENGSNWPEISNDCQNLTSAFSEIKHISDGIHVPVTQTEVIDQNKENRSGYSASVQRLTENSSLPLSNFNSDKENVYECNFKSISSDLSLTSDMENIPVACVMQNTATLYNPAASTGTSSTVPIDWHGTVTNQTRPASATFSSSTSFGDNGVNQVINMLHSSNSERSSRNSGVPNSSVNQVMSMLRSEQSSMSSGLPNSSIPGQISNAPSFSNDFLTSENSNMFCADTKKINSLIPSQHSVNSVMLNLENVHERSELDSNDCTALLDKLGEDDIGAMLVPNEVQLNEKRADLNDGKLDKESEMKADNLFEIFGAFGNKPSETVEAQIPEMCEKVEPQKCEKFAKVFSMVNPDYSNITEESQPGNPPFSAGYVNTCSPAFKQGFKLFGVDVSNDKENVNVQTPSKQMLESLHEKVMDNVANSGSTIRNWLLPNEEAASPRSENTLNTPVHSRIVECNDTVGSGLEILPTGEKSESQEVCENVELEQTCDDSKVAEWIQKQTFDPTMNSELSLQGFDDLNKHTDKTDQDVISTTLANVESRNIFDMFKCAEDVKDDVPHKSCSERNPESVINEFIEDVDDWSDSSTSISDCTLENFRCNMKTNEETHVDANEMKEAQDAVNSACIYSQSGEKSNTCTDDHVKRGFSDWDNASVKSGLSSTVTERGIKISGLASLKCQLGSSISSKQGLICDALSQNNAVSDQGNYVVKTEVKSNNTHHAVGQSFLNNVSPVVNQTFMLSDKTSELQSVKIPDNKASVPKGEKKEQAWSNIKPKTGQKDVAANAQKTLTAVVPNSQQSFTSKTPSSLQNNQLQLANSLQGNLNMQLNIAGAPTPDQGSTPLHISVPDNQFYSQQSFHSMDFLASPRQLTLASPRQPQQIAGPQDPSSYMHSYNLTNQNMTHTQSNAQYFSDAQSQNSSLNQNNENCFSQHTNFLSASSNFLQQNWQDQTLTGKPLNRKRKKSESFQTTSSTMLQFTDMLSNDKSRSNEGFTTIRLDDIAENSNSANFIRASLKPTKTQKRKTATGVKSKKKGTAGSIQSCSSQNSHQSLGKDINCGTQVNKTSAASSQNDQCLRYTQSVNMNQTKCNRPVDQFRPLASTIFGENYSKGAKMQNSHSVSQMQKSQNCSQMQSNYRASQMLTNQNDAQMQFIGAQINNNPNAAQMQFNGAHIENNQNGAQVQYSGAQISNNQSGAQIQYSGVQRQGSGAQMQNGPTHAQLQQNSYNGPQIQNSSSVSQGFPIQPSLRHAVQRHALQRNQMTNGPNYAHIAENSPNYTTANRTFTNNTQIPMFQHSALGINPVQGHVPSPHYGYQVVGNAGSPVGSWISPGYQAFSHMPQMNVYGYQHPQMNPFPSQQNAYNAVQTGDMKLTFRKVGPELSVEDQQHNDLTKYWNVKKAGDCRLVFRVNAAGKRKAEEETPVKDSSVSELPNNGDNYDVDQPFVKRRRCLVY